MKSLDKKAIESIMKLIIWDYDINPYALYEIVTGKKERVGQFDKERIFVRMIERLSWYDLLNILGAQFIKEYLTRDIIKKIHYKDMQERYEFVRKILQGEAVSFSGWGHEYRERIKSTLLSNRWYSDKQILS
jgi:hypothetical protein